METLQKKLENRKFPSNDLLYNEFSSCIMNPKPLSFPLHFLLYSASITLLLGKELSLTRIREKAKADKHTDDISR